MKLQNSIGVLLAAALVSGSVQPAFAGASDTQVEIAVDSYVLTSADAAGKTVSLGVYVDTPPLTGFSLIIGWDERLTCVSAELQNENEYASLVRSSAPLAAMITIYPQPAETEGKVLELAFTLPEDVQPGEHLGVFYLPSGPTGVACDWSNVLLNIDYAASGDVIWQDGGFTVMETQEDVGDVNGDGLVSLQDLVMLQRYLLSSVYLSDSARKAADLDRDGTADVFDLALLKNRLTF